MNEAVSVTETLDVTQTPAAVVETELVVPVPLGPPVEQPVSEPSPPAPLPPREPQPTSGSGS